MREEQPGGVQGQPPQLQGALKGWVWAGEKGRMGSLWKREMKGESQIWEEKGEMKGGKGKRVT